MVKQLRPKNLDYLKIINPKEYKLEKLQICIVNFTRCELTHCKAAKVDNTVPFLLPRGLFVQLYGWEKISWCALFK